MEETPCITCSSTDFRYDEEVCRNICNVCNAMQEITGMGITTFENEATVRFNRLQTIKLKSSKKLTKAERKEEVLRNASPWELEQIFRWLFEIQIESMRPHVADWSEYQSLCWGIWAKYMDATGVNFDLVNARHEEVRLRKYPVGWGVRHDPRRGENPLKRATRQLHRLQKEARLDNEDYDYDDEADERAAKNRKKVRIERMVHMKRVDKEEREQERLLMESAGVGNEDGKGDTASTKAGGGEIKKEERKRRACTISAGINKQGNSSDDDDVMMDDIANDSDSDDVVESELSDEEDPSYLQLDYMDERDKTTVRILRKKKPHEVMFNGSFFTIASRLMETNIVMLFLGLYFSREKLIHCCCLMDVLGLVARRQIPYISIRRFIPPLMFPIADTSYHYYLLRDRAPSWSFMLCCFNKVVRDLRFNFLVKADIEGLTHRMVADLNLPASLCNLTDHIRKLTKKNTDRHSGAKDGSRLIRTNFSPQRYSDTLAPEPLCLAHIFLALRGLLKLDSSYELRTSALAREVALSVDEATTTCGTTCKADSSSLLKGPTRLFIWTEWWKAECKAPDLDSARTWRNLERDRDAGSNAFLGGTVETGCAIDDDISRYNELGLQWQEGVNNRGRIARPDVPHSHQPVIDQIQKPLRAVLESFKPQLLDSVLDKPSFTETEIQYLVEPRPFWDKVFAERGLPSGPDCAPGLRDRLKELNRLVEQHDLSLTRISFNQTGPDDDVLDRNFSSNLTEIETDLLETLTHGTGLSVNEVFPLVAVLERALFEIFGKYQPRKKLKYRRKVKRCS